ncbi:MAG: carbohydrate ABC transporter permease, partial [bacterium]
MYNTVAYCILAILAALIVNPMAAYAMSRHKLRSSYALLLFMLLTMAFPPMVTQIPSFLMLREFHLLNTLAALIIPGLANGFSIFLLKGFFDALPRELYEAAEVDGGSEWAIFWRITMSLSKPILSVIALGAFVGAYGNFMFALLICQDERMWTLMVWLYQLQQRSGRPVVYASIVIASIPTFIVFVLCQRVILRGIIVPTEK